MRNRRDLGQPSDIAFLLIIFFLLLSGIGANHSIPLSLTGDGNQADTAQEQQLFLVLDEEGSLFLDNKVINAAQIGSHIYEKTHIELAIEPDTKWQQVVNVLFALQQHPYASLTLEVLP